MEDIIENNQSVSNTTDTTKEKGKAQSKPTFEERKKDKLIHVSYLASMYRMNHYQRNSIEKIFNGSKKTRSEWNKILEQYKII